MNGLIIIMILSLIFIAIILSRWRRESYREYISDEEDELLWDIVYEKKSPLQKIEFLKRDEDNTFVLLLNDEIQVHSNEYKISHNLQCSVPIERYKPKKILILGGGDLIAASFCLKYDFVESVTLVEIDSEVYWLLNTEVLFVTADAEVKSYCLWALKGTIAISLVENCL